MEDVLTTRRGFVKGAVMGAACAGLGIAGTALADEATAEPTTEPAEKVITGGPSEPSDLPDTYTTATPAMFKEMVEGEQYDAALQYLADASHYLYVERVTPYYGNCTTFPETGFDTEWRSPINGRPYRGAFYDPLNRSVIWLSTNPNGSTNASVGSYWAAIPPNTELEFTYNEIQGYEPQPDWQIVCYMYNGQSAQNFMRTGRGTLMIDGALADQYGLTSGWGYNPPANPDVFTDRDTLAVEVKLRSYTLRQVTPQQFYDGYLPYTTGVFAPGVWGALPGWGSDAGDDQFRTIAQFWGCAEGSEAELNLTTDEERAAYIERANNDPAVIDALTGMTVDLYFDIMQVVNVKQEIGFDFEQGSGKINGIDMDHDGLLDRYPEGHEKAGEIILQNGYGDSVRRLPDWIYELNLNEDWWVASDDLIINSAGKKVVGANPDGTYILEDE